MSSENRCVNRNTFIKCCQYSIISPCLADEEAETQVKGQAAVTKLMSHTDSEGSIPQQDQVPWGQR